MADKNTPGSSVAKSACEPQRLQFRAIYDRLNQAPPAPRHLSDAVVNPTRYIQPSTDPSAPVSESASITTALMPSHSSVDENSLETGHVSLRSLSNLTKSQPFGELTDLNSHSRNPRGNPPSGPSRNSRSSVRHLTCFWWKEKGFCRFSDSECLYAHRDTGHYTDPPRQVIPGEPALAGRKLDRAMRSLAMVHRPSPSLSSIANSRHGSRPVTPAFEHGSPIPSPNAFNAPDIEMLKLANDNHFLRTLVDQNGREKSVLVHHIEDLQAENRSMKTEVMEFRQAQIQLLDEHEALQNIIKRLEDQNDQLRSLASSYSAIGLYGRPRMNSEVRYLGGLLDE